MQKARSCRLSIALAAALLAASLTACGDKASNIPSEASSKSAPAAAAPKKPDSKAKGVLLRAAVNESDESSCWIDLTVKNQTREKVSMMARFDAVLADNGETIEGAHNVESVIFNSVEPESSRESLQPVYIEEPCDTVRLHLRSVHCISGDCEPELEAEGIAGIEDKRD